MILVVQNESVIRITTLTPYLTLTGDFVENWPRYNGTALYIMRKS